MQTFNGKLAVVTGAGSGIGREVAIQLAQQGAILALGDINNAGLEQTKQLCEQASGQSNLITLHCCDVSNQEKVFDFKQAVVDAHQCDSIDLLFNIAGVGGAASFLNDSQTEWERTFNVCWYGVYYCTRAFMPLLVESEASHLINMSSINGVWPCNGPTDPNTAYSAAKFAVRGFTEALVVDLNLNAPHVKVSVVMPGHVGTPIISNSIAFHGKPTPEAMTDKEIDAVRKRFMQQGVPEDQLDDETVRRELQDIIARFAQSAPLNAAQAAEIILDGVKAQKWRILVGEDAKLIDKSVREQPELAYSPEFMSLIQ